jgi:ElaB/YqjD/DUF883 family membrane-anchored ribosome-binding protein
MLDLVAAKELGEALLWFLTLGKSDAKQIRDELQDLLSHCSQTLKSMGELTEALYKIKLKDFKKEFPATFFHCTTNFTSPDAARRARSHCTDIKRDVERINFKVTKILRTEIGSWKSLNEAFKKFARADDDFLDQFENDMAKVDKELLEILRMMNKKPKEAWQRYEQLRSGLLDDIDELKEEFNTMRKAENHIRLVLT